MFSVLNTESAHYSRYNFPQQLLHAAEGAHDQVIARANSYCMRSFTFSTVPLNVPNKECAQLKYMFRITRLRTIKIELLAHCFHPRCRLVLLNALD